MGRKIETLEGMMRKLGKIKAVIWINDYITERVSPDMTISEICHVLWAYHLEEQTLKVYDMHFGTQKY